MHFWIEKRLTEGVYLISADGHKALWSRCKLRKPRACAATGTQLAKGEIAYRPTGNQLYRYRRLSQTYVEQAPSAPFQPLNWEAVQAAERLLGLITSRTHLRRIATYVPGMDVIARRATYRLRRRTPVWGVFLGDVLVDWSFRRKLSRELADQVEPDYYDRYDKRLRVRRIGAI